MAGCLLRPLGPPMLAACSTSQLAPLIVSAIAGRGEARRSYIGIASAGPSPSTSASAQILNPPPGAASLHQARHKLPQTSHTQRQQEELRALLDVAAAQQAVAARPWHHRTRLHYRAIFIDAAGTLLLPTEPAAEVLLRYARPYGCQLSKGEILDRFRRVYNAPWTQSTRRYVGDARPFWHHIVSQSTGCDSRECSEAVYQYYASTQAWCLAPGARHALERLKGAGLKLAVVSNFDTRLRPLLRELGVLPLMDAVIVSAEVGAEKPNPVIFDAALSRLNDALAAKAAAARTCGQAAAAGLHLHLGPSASWHAVPGGGSRSGSSSSSSGGSSTAAYNALTPLLQPHEVLHIGDDRRNDVWGARDAGCSAWLWGVDVHSWRELADELLLGGRPAAAK